MSMKEYLKKFKEGELSETELIEALSSLFLVSKIGNEARIDLNRGQRIGFPEIINATGKNYKDIKKIISEALRDMGKVFISLVTDDLEKKIRSDFENPIAREGNLMVIRNNEEKETVRGKVALITAGTSDVPLARETGLLLNELGVETFTYYDVGVSGLHRIFDSIVDMAGKSIDAIVVFAGMDGILPTLVASLTSLPIIGVPVSTGYGKGGRGNGALVTMLQSCAPGLTVVNIDNSVGAAASIFRIIKSKRG